MYTLAPAPRELRVVPAGQDEAERDGAEGADDAEDGGKVGGEEADDVRDEEDGGCGEIEQSRGRGQQRLQRCQQGQQRRACREDYVEAWRARGSCQHASMAVW